MRHAILISLLVVALPARAERRALMPETGPLLQSALQKAAPTWRLDSAQIQADHVDVRACTSERDCFDFLLAKRAPCAGVVAGPWCLTWKGPPPANEPVTVLVSVLATTPDSIWRDPGAPIPRPPPDPSARRRAYQVALLLTLAPLLAGFLLGLLVRRSRSRLLRIVTTLALAGLTALALPRTPLGAWDILWLGGLTILAFLFATIERLRPMGVAFTGALLVLGLMVLEFAARRLASAPREYPDPAEARLTFRPADAMEACRAIDAPEHPNWLEWRRNGIIPPGERVLHLGDSMVAGVPGAGPDETFAAELDRLDPGYAHVNLGVVGSSTDAQYVILQTWIDRVQPKRVVLHLFAGNDLDEMDQAYSCCDLGSFLSYEGSRVIPRCTTPVWRFATSQYLDESPPPYPIRVGTSFSWTARLMMESFHTAGSRLSTWVDYRSRRRNETSWQHLEWILRALKEDLARRNIGFVVSVLPYRMALESNAPDSVEEWRIGARMIETVKRVGVPVLDPRDYLRGIVRQEGSATVFVTPPDQEVHFNPEGHRRYARWLLEQLGPGLKGAPRP